MTESEEEGKREHLKVTYAYKNHFHAHIGRAALEPKLRDEERTERRERSKKQKMRRKNIKAVH